MARFRLEDGSVSGDKTQSSLGVAGFFSYARNEDGNEVFVGAAGAVTAPNQLLNVRLGSGQSFTGVTVKPAFP